MRKYGRVDKRPTVRHSLTGNDIKCLSSELDGRKLVKSKKGDEFQFPAISEHDDDDTLDLTMLKQLIGANFNSEDPLTFKSQYQALCHYSKTTPLNVRQLDQIFTLMLKGAPLQYYTSLHPTLPLKEKIRNLLTVFSYRSSVGDRIRELEQFERKPYEPLDSVYLRLSAILDSTASLVPPSTRSGRCEHVLSHAIYTLALPAARHRLAKFRAERTANGQFLTSKELLRNAMRFEEGLPNNRREPLPLNLRDPFINPGEVPRYRNPEKANVLPYDSSHEEHRVQDYTNSKPVPNLWPSTPIEKDQQGRDELKQNIESLSQRIDELSRTYNDKLTVSKAKPSVVETHNVTEEEHVTQKQERDDSKERSLGNMLESFLRAQYEFYRNFNYENAQGERRQSFLRFDRWGSRYTRETNPQEYERPYNRNQFQNRPSFRRPFYPPRSMGYDTTSMENNHGQNRRYPTPKRIRFSEFIAQGTPNNTTPSGRAPDSPRPRRTDRINPTPRERNDRQELINNRGIKRDLDGMEETQIGSSTGRNNIAGSHNTGFQPMPSLNHN